MRKLSIFIFFAMLCCQSILAQAPKLDEKNGQRKIELAPDKPAEFVIEKGDAISWIKDHLPAKPVMTDTTNTTMTVTLFFSLVINEEGKVIRAPIIGAMDLDVEWKKKVSAIVRDMPRWKPAEKEGKKVVSRAAVAVPFY
jgi:hypothetical protein